MGLSVQGIIVDYLREKKVVVVMYVCHIVKVGRIGGQITIQKCVKNLKIETKIGN